MTLLLPSAQRLMQLSFPLAVELSCFLFPSLYCKSVCIFALSFLFFYLSLCISDTVSGCQCSTNRRSARVLAFSSLCSGCSECPCYCSLLRNLTCFLKSLFRTDCFLPWWLIAMFQSHFAYLNRWFPFSGITELVNNVLQPQQKSQNDKEPEPDA